MRNFFDLHPAVRIVLWASGASLAFSGNAHLLAALSLLGLLYPGSFLKLLRRSRWVILALFAVFSFSTPGEAVFQYWAYPTREGVVAGALQAWKIAAAIAALSLLLSSTPRMALLSGIYDLLRPFSALGLRPERVAVRLWLTLDYADGAKATLGEAFEEKACPETRLQLELYRLRPRDYAALLFASGAILL